MAGSDSLFRRVVNFAVTTSSDSNDQNLDYLTIDPVDDSSVACSDSATPSQAAT